MGLLIDQTHPGFHFKQSFKKLIPVVASIVVVVCEFFLQLHGNDISLHLCDILID